MSAVISLNLIQIISHCPSELDGDEIFLKRSGKKIWPASEKYFHAREELIPVKSEITLLNFGFIDLELWDHNKWASNSCLGIFRVLIDRDTKFRNVYDCNLIHRGKAFSSYSLHWEIIQRADQKANIISTSTLVSKM